ncbi:uncharacterized protein [Littorina saxatilis]|uniref:uncharacterized protein n=1 Tax=Littorina saxatilis TaxID=31220 RepID=UPI0038B4CA8E
MFDIDRALDRQTTSVQVAKEPTSRHSSVTPSVGSSTHKSASVKSASHKAASITSAIHKSASHKSGSRRSGSQVASRAESLRSKSVSSEDTKLALKLEAASLAIKVEGDAIKEAQFSELDLLQQQYAERTAARQTEEAERTAARQTEEAERTAARQTEEAERNAARLIEETARQAKEAKRTAARQAEEAARQAEDTARQAKEAERIAARQAEDAAEAALEDIKQKKALRQIQSTELKISLREQQAMLQVLEQGESVQQDLPDLPSVDLLNTRFHPRPFVPLYSLMAPPPNNEHTAIGIGTGAAVIADQGTHQPALDVTSVPVCQAAVIADQRTHQPAMDFTSVPVCQAASTHDISTVNVNAAVTNFVAGTTTTEPQQHALPVVDLVVGVSASTSAATTNNATYEAYGPQRREDVNAPHHVGMSAPFVHQEPFTPNYTTAATTSSMRPTALLTTLQHPLGAYTGQPPLHNVGHSTTSVTGSRPPDLDHTGWSYHLPETREGDETQERHTYFPEERHQRMDHRRFQVTPPCFPYDTHLHPKPEPFVPTFLDPHQTTPKVIWGNENARPPAYMNFDKECHADRPFASYPPSAYYQRPFATPAKQDTPMDSLAKTLSDALMINRLPMQEPCIFVGDPLQYPIWRSSFSFLIERQNITSSEKLLYLQRYIGGQAKEAVTGFFLLREGDAYERAMEVLENRFGNSYVVSQAFRTKLDEWTPVKSKDPKGLRSLADFLQQCSVAAQEVGGLSILDDAQYLRKIVGKLPDWMSHRWSRTVARTKVEKKRYPLFNELVSFVTLEADISNDPVFGLTSASGTPRKFTTNLSTLTEDVTACLHCQLPDHDAGTCKELIEKPLVEIRDFLFKNRICYGCLRSKDHQSRQCKQKQTCKKCKKAHPTCLHDDNFKYQNSMSENKGASEHKNNYRTSAADVQEPLSSSTPTVSALKASEENSIGFTSMIVPVLVSSDSNPNVEVLTYALLDTMSNATFVVQSVAEEVKAKSQPTTLRVSTLTEDNAVVSGRKYSGLRVRSPSSREFVRLPSAISRPYLTVDPTHIPTSETVKAYPHLQHLSPKLPPLYPDCEAGLLIGYDCAEALMPLNVVQGLPFAVETKLGWSIVGKAPHSVAFDGIASSMRVIVKPGSREEERVAHVYKVQVDEVSCTDPLHVMERDFASDSGSMSQDDVKFMKIVKENVKINEAGHYEMPLPFRPEKPSLPDNRGATVKRLMGLKRQKKRGYRDDCVKVMTLILYGLIVTCFASRAIHIETLDDMSSDSFINALRIVVLHDQNLCRSEWCMARVIEVMPGSDGLVRRVKVHVGTKALDNHGRPTGDSRILERPIHKMTVSRL